MNRKNAERTIQAIQERTDIKFNMGHFHSCICGFAATLATGAQYTKSDEGAKSLFEIGQNFLGLSYAEASMLFAPTSNRAPWKHRKYTPLDRITRESAITAIRAAMDMWCEPDPVILPDVVAEEELVLV